MLQAQKCNLSIIILYVSGVDSVSEALTSAHRSGMIRLEIIVWEENNLNSVNS